MLKTASFVYQWVSHLLCASLQDKLNISSLVDENYRTRTHLDDPDEEITNHVSVNLAEAAEIHKSIKICKPWLGENIWSNKTVELSCSVYISNLDCCFEGKYAFIFVLLTP